MAKKSNIDLDKTETNSFIKGLNKDSDSSFIQDGMWTHARNVVNNTIEGNLGTLSGEPANYLCATAGLTAGPGKPIIIGTIHLYSDKWLIYTAIHVDGQVNSINSEIGLFEEDLCKYRVIVQDPCLNFNKFNLVYGAAREKEDCSWAVYWNDALNPDRYLNVGDPQTWPGNDFIYTGNNTYTNGTEQLQWPGVAWVQECTELNGCFTCVNATPATLDCDKLRLARLMETPCLHVEDGKAGGTLRNGSYFAVIAYSIEGEKVTDWFSPSNVQPIWFENDLQGALEITVNADKENFSEFILVVVANINQGAVAKRVGVYSTNTQTIYIDQLKEDLVAVPLEQLPIQTPVFEKSDQIVEVNNYLLRVGPTSKFDFNYQPLANLIKAKWVSVEYPADYYVKGGYKPSYLRDETYSFFVRWVYDTGDKSSSYHIPGRAPIQYNGIDEDAIVVGNPTYNQNVLFTDPTEQERLFEVKNTATITPVSPPEVLEDGGKIIARGTMGYWQSTEIYPDNKPEVWNSSYYCWTGLQNSPSPNWDLCGLPIRHHKFPDNVVNNSFLANHFYTDPVSNITTIRILGVEFENIICPKDNEGNDIPGIVGYEILRGSREGNKTIIAKGMLNNLRPYNIKGPANQNRKGLYPNHPFNTIVPPNPINSSNGTLNSSGQANDPYIKVTDKDDERVDINITDIPGNFNTFHSPDTQFRNPFLSTTELKIYGNLRGISEQYFVEPDQHPNHKFISDFSVTSLVVAGAIEALISIGGDVTFTQPGGAFTSYYGIPTAQGTLVTGTPAYNATTLTADYADYLLGQTSFTAALAGYFGTSQGIIDSFTGYLGLSAYYQNYLNSGNLFTAPTISLQNSLSRLLGIATAVGQTLYYFSQGAELALRTIYAVLPYRQYALQMLAHGFYDGFASLVPAAVYRFKIEDSLYLKDNIQDIKPYSGNQYRVNNLKRQKSVLLRTKTGYGTDTGPYFITDTSSTGYYDQSLLTIGTARKDGSSKPFGNIDFDDKTAVMQAKIASHYGAIKVRLRNQYGQLDSIKQIPITPCEQKLSEAPVSKPIRIGTCKQTICEGTIYPVIYHKIITKTPVLFNGDTYVNRYTEKNNMFFFYDWLYGQPDGYEYNYLLRQMFPEPRFWINSQRYEVTDLFNPLSIFNPPAGTGWLPSAFHQFDNKNYNYGNDNEGNTPGEFGVKESYFYLATSAIRDFFVESDVIVDYREAGPEPFQKFTDLLACVLDGAIVHLK